jgi:sporulation protein YlmC with PRC-barrel domain
MATMQEIETWRGRTLVDRDGDKIGKIEDVYLDRSSGEPEWVAVKTGPVRLEPELRSDPGRLGRR